MSKRKDIAVIGYGETKVTLKGGRSSYDLAGEVLEQILNQTGIDKDKIDGLSIAETMSETQNPFWGVYMSEMLGLSPSWMQLNGLGGTSGIGGIARAAAAIRDGLCETCSSSRRTRSPPGATPSRARSAANSSTPSACAARWARSA